MRTYQSKKGEKEMICPRCGREDYVKNGFTKGKQRYKCKHCQCNYTKSFKQGYPIEIKRKAIKYYLDGMGFRRIERLLVISHVSVINWVRQLAKKINEIEEFKKEKEFPKERIIELDELYTYVKKKKTQHGSGLLLAEIPKRYWDIMLELVN